MDWSKSKTILIIAFFILNIFLVYRLWDGEVQGDITPWISPREKEEVISYLEKNNVLFTGELKEEIKTKSFYEVSGRYMKDEDIFASFDLNIKDFEKIERENYDLYLDQDNILVSRFDSGKVHFYFPGGYVPDNALFSPGIYEKDRIFYWVGELTRKLPVNKDLYLEDIHFDEEDNRAELIYHQKMNGDNFYGGYFKATVTSKGIEKGKFFFLDYEGESETFIEIIPATTALLRIINHLPQGKENIITSLELGYFTQEFYAESWEAVPVWKISTENGDEYYLNAFTGELEGKREAFEF